jgi:hypothetical protein
MSSFKSTLAANSSIAALRVAPRQDDLKHGSAPFTITVGPISPPASEDKRNLSVASSEDGVAVNRQRKTAEPLEDYNGRYSFAPIKGALHASTSGVVRHETFSDQLLDLPLIAPEWQVSRAMSRRYGDDMMRTAISDVLIVGCGSAVRPSRLPSDPLKLLTGRIPLSLSR